MKRQCGKTNIFLLILVIFIFNLKEINGVSENCLSHVKSYNSSSPSIKRWAIVALGLFGRKDIDRRNKILAQKLRPYAANHEITFIFFSEKNFPPQAIQNWKRQLSGVAEIKIINTSNLGFANQKEKFGYKYMCKFFALDLYDYLYGKYDYYMRCDTDCFIRVLDYDLLDWVEQNEVEYGYAVRKLEPHKETIQTLIPWTLEYVKKCQVTPSAPLDRPLDVAFNFYNNFHIGKVSFFARPDVRHYLEAANNSGNIYNYRWGDSTIQAYALRLFMDPTAIAMVPDFKYSHGVALVSTFGDGSESKIPQRLPKYIT